MKHIYFIRHGECELNLQKAFAGQLDTPLTELGRTQAEQAARSIADKQLTIDAIVTSPLSRAHDTATIVARTINYPIQDITVSKFFIERGYGILEGTSRSEFFDSHSYQDIDFAPHAESLEELHKRAQYALEQLKTLPATNILVVSHSGFYRAFRRAITGEDFSHEYTSPFSSIKHGTVYDLGEI